MLLWPTVIDVGLIYCDMKLKWSSFYLGLPAAEKEQFPQGKKKEKDLQANNKSLEAKRA